MAIFYKNNRLWIFFLSTALLIILVLSFSLFKMLCITDLAVEPIHKLATADQEKLGNPGVYLVSYADGDPMFFQNQNILVQSTLNKGVDFFLNYNRSHLSPDFYAQNKHVLDQKLGAGLWLWKPWIILDALNKMPEDAILIYMDAGLSAYRPLDDIINLAAKHNIVLYSYPPGEVKSIVRVKRDAFIKVGCDEERCHNADYIQATFLALKNNEVSRKFIAEWLHYCSDESVLSRAPSVLAPEHPAFSNHGDDQSVLSAVYYKNPIGYVISQTDLAKYMSFHRRKPGEKPAYSTLLYDTHKYSESGQKKIRGWEAKFINSKLFVALRKMVIQHYHGADQ